MSAAADDRVDPTTTRLPVSGPATDPCGARQQHASGGK